MHENDDAAIVVAADGTETTALARESATILDVIARAAQDPTVDVAKLERLLDIQERLIKDQRRTAFFAALSALEAELPQLTKKGNVIVNGALRSKFARIEDIDAAIRPLCRTHGFAFSFDSKPSASGIEFSCTMSHRDGHAETKTLTLPTDKGAGRNEVQAVGSTTSYARRYLLAMHLHLVTRDEDDDGNGGSKPVTAVQAAELRRTLAEAGGDAARFLNWIAAATFEEIPAACHTRAVAFIEEKRRNKR